MNRIKLKKILFTNSKRIINLFYVENDFYCSIIYHPTKQWWEPIKISLSHEHSCRASQIEEESDLSQFLKTSLQAHGDLNRTIIEDRNKNLEEELISISK
jgi:hypothetical protein